MFFLVGLHYFIYGVDFDFLELPPIEVMDIFVQFSQSLPKFGVEMVLNTVISPSNHFMGDNGPLISDLIMKPIEFLFVFLSPPSLNEKVLETPRMSK